MKKLLITIFLMMFVLCSFGNALAIDKKVCEMYKGRIVIVFPNQPSLSGIVGRLIEIITVHSINHIVKDQTYIIITELDGINKRVYNIRDVAKLISWHK